jgi:hypothetical protein
MALAGARLTPEQATSWAAGMDALERRERLADRAAGVVRRAAGLPTGGRVGAPRPGETGLLLEPDPRTEPPPPRTTPAPHAPDDDDEPTLSDRLTSPELPPPATPSRSWDDEPPF